jgi:uracil phosphoribosyltransferase
MIATGGSIAAVVGMLHKWGAKKIHVIAVLASRDGINALAKAYPDVTISIITIDEGVSDEGHITPGLGDVGDRLFKTYGMQQAPDEEEEEKKKKGKGGAASAKDSPGKRKR